ncbi:MAG: zinc transporter ZupT [archaeon]
MLSQFLSAIMITFLAGLSTLIGSSIIIFVNNKKDNLMGIAMGFAAGVMLFISLSELLPQSIINVGKVSAIISFFAGILIIYLIDVLIPHAYEEENACNPEKEKCDLKRCGILIAVGIAIHNFPEGIAVFFSSLVNMHLGLTIAMAIALHNIPEGIAVAMPIYYSTGSKKQAFFFSFISGIAEPIGAIFAYILLSKYLSSTLLYTLLAAVAGIMVFICFDELLPNAFKQKNNHLTIAGIFLGMAVVAISLIFF